MSTVASSAARMSLSQRSARNNDSRLSAAINFDFPAMIPACGPPNNLSPLNETRSTPFRSVSAGGGPMLQAGNGFGLDHRAAAQVFDEWDPLAARQLGDGLGRGRVYKTIHK